MGHSRSVTGLLYVLVEMYVGGRMGMNFYTLRSHFFLKRDAAFNLSSFFLYVYIYIYIYIYTHIQGYYKRNRHFQRYVVSKPLA